jgi:hypothetical protein
VEITDKSLRTAESRWKNARERMNPPFLPASTLRWFFRPFLSRFKIANSTMARRKHCYDIRYLQLNDKNKRHTLACVSYLKVEIFKGEFDRGGLVLV